MPEYLRVSPKALGRQCIYAFMFLLAYLAVFYGRTGEVTLLDGFFTTGMLFIFVGGLRFCRFLGFYDPILYGYKKMFSYFTKTGAPGSYYEFKEQAAPSFSEPLYTGMVYVAVSLLLLFIS